MPNAHYFAVDDLAVFLERLRQRGYGRGPGGPDDAGWIVLEKTLAQALTKQYAYPLQREPLAPTQIRVTYRLLREGKPLARLARELKRMNSLYRKALPVWKTKAPSSRREQHRRWHRVQRWLARYQELIECFQYPADPRLTEGNNAFNVMIASTPREQRICFEFIKALVEALAPEGIVRGRREVDNLRQQRNGWIKRYAYLHRKRGWTPVEIAREIQKELREGTWDERRRQRLQYNLANNTILKIAGLKLPAHQAHALNN